MLTDAERQVFLNGTGDHLRTRLTHTMEVAGIARNIVRALRRWTRETQGVLITSLLQPAPEVVDMFDTLILMRDGCVVYNGPRDQVMSYLNDINVRK